MIRTDLVYIFKRTRQMGSKGLLRGNRIAMHYRVQYQTVITDNLT